MAINRWVGQAPARRAEAYFIPRSVAAGTRYHLTDGVRKNSFQYFPVTGGFEETALERSARVVSGLVASSSSLTGLSGGSSDALAYSVATYNGEPAVKVIGGSAGQPISLAASVTQPTTSSIKVERVQTGTAGSDFVFVMRWPVTPSAGTWAITGNNALPVILDWDASAAEVETAIESFSLPCATVTVTGSHSAGYTVALSGLTEEITSVPVSFPIVPVLSTGLGVNNNASYKLTTVDRPGVVNQESVLAELDGNQGTFYQFASGDKLSEFFSGTATLAMVEQAAFSVWGQASVSVSRATDGTNRFVLRFGGTLSEKAVDVRVLIHGQSTGLTVTTAVTATEPAALVYTYEFSGGVTNGTWKFIDDIVDGSADITFPWLSNTAITPANILAALVTIDPDYGVVLSASNITVTNRAVGAQFAVDRITIEFPARGSSTGTATVSTRYWLGINTSNLLVNTPLVSVTSTGSKAAVEIQTVSIENSPTGGTFTLTYDATESDPLESDATASEIAAAVLDISGDAVTVIGGNGGPYRIKWPTAAAKSKLVGDSTNLTISNSPTFVRVDVELGTGPNYFNNADNWSLGRVPEDDDLIVFSDCNVSCSYGLTTTILPEGIDIYRTMAGSIGLPELRSDGSLETLNRWLTFSGSHSSGSFRIRAGLGDSGSGPAIVRIDAGGIKHDTVVQYTQQSQALKVFAIKGSDVESTLVVNRGEVALGIFPEDTAVLASVQLTPTDRNGDTVRFSSSANSVIGTLSQSGGSSSLGSPPSILSVTGGTMTINGTGNAKSLEVQTASVQWIADGVVGVSGTPSAVLFGSGFDSSSSTPARVRLTSAGHGLTSGSRVYIRSTGGVVGLDGKTFAVSVVDANNFDLIGSLAYGTLTGYAGTVKWALEKAIVCGAGGVINFDGDGRTRDIVAPVVVQGTGRVIDSKASITDLRLWPEQVPGLADYGSMIELRRVRR
jgi:hypothetical protein